MKKKKLIRRIIVLGILILFFIVGVGGVALYVKKENEELRVYRYGNATQDDSLSLTVTRKESWPKVMPQTELYREYFKDNRWEEFIDGTNSTAYGITYEFSVTNMKKYPVSDWYFKAVVPNDLFINKAWNGEVEFHQFGDEHVFTFNPMTVNSSALRLEYIEVDELLLFPMAKGDYFIYYPSEEYQETPISASTPDEGSLYTKTFGVIVYSSKSAVAFTNIQLFYHIKMSITSVPLFWAFISAIAISLLFIIMTGVELGVIHRYDVIRRHDEKLVEQSIGAFAKFIDSKDAYTSGHSLRVARYSRLIASKMGFNEEECRNIYYIGLLHDCGKVAIPGGILNKPGKLTAEEYDIVKSHTVRGAEILTDFTAIDGLKDGIMYHHERYDGGGYPKGLKAESIPLVARIIGIADAYDAMNSTRCYREKLTDEAILAQLTGNSATQFDPQILEIFLNLIENGELNSESLIEKWA